MPSLAQRAVAEWLGTAFLLAAVVGSGIMPQRLAGGNGALALLCNTLPTGAILVVLILTFGPLSGAHFNPAMQSKSWPSRRASSVIRLKGKIPVCASKGQDAVANLKKVVDPALSQALADTQSAWSAAVQNRDGGGGHTYKSDCSCAP